MGLPRVVVARGSPVVAARPSLVPVGAFSPAQGDGTSPCAGRKIEEMSHSVSSRGRKIKARTNNVVFLGRVI
ncbi:hypothetical protein GW17_00013840 [Ensete ventricosum]|nr:hypothetical protein GW17_00013840 [Ensete ventricosum]RZS05121.1 hypothetical protein BHM03_00035570 [Ensete ventricosum]